jgi:hypothetical protein
MKRDNSALERFIVGQLALGDSRYAPAFGLANAIPHAYLLEKANRQFRPTDATNEEWEDITDTAFRRAYANSETGVCCCDAGLYLPNSPEDIKACEDYLLSKIRGVGRRIGRIRRAHPEFGPYRNQLTLPGLDESDAEIEEGR